MNAVEAARLRQLCQAYSDDILTDVVGQALLATVEDATARRSLAALVVSRLRADIQDAEPPPLSTEAVARLLDGLKRRAH
jgi:hypothetical protein